MRNALQFDLHNGGSPAPPIYALKVYVASTQFTAYVDPTTGRPDLQIEIVIASYQLVELATGKMVLNDTTNVHAMQVGADISATDWRRISLRGLSPTDQSAYRAADHSELANGPIGGQLNAARKRSAPLRNRQTRAAP